jgi:hypothetical protein
MTGSTMVAPKARRESAAYVNETMFADVNVVDEGLKVDLKG